jgi:hypothetical protein
MRSLRSPCDRRATLRASRNFDGIKSRPAWFARAAGPGNCTTILLVAIVFAPLINFLLESYDGFDVGILRRGFGRTHYVRHQHQIRRSIVISFVLLVLGKLTSPQVFIRRHTASEICDVVVLVRDQEMVLRCPSYSQALRWARLECKSYKIPEPTAPFAGGCPGDIKDGV